MNRHSVRQKMALALAAAVVAVSTVGCTSLLLTAVYLFNGNDAWGQVPRFAGQDRGGRSCKPMLTLQDSSANVTRELAKQCCGVVGGEGR